MLQLDKEDPNLRVEEQLTRTSIVLQPDLFKKLTGEDYVDPHFDSVAAKILYTSSQPSASTLLHVGVRAPQDAGLPLREPRLNILYLCKNLSFLPPFNRKK